MSLADDILSRAEALLGSVPESRLVILSQLCDAAQTSYLNCLGGSVPDDAAEAFTSAVAVAAVASFLELETALVGGGTIRVGDVSVSARHDGIADGLRDLADALLAPWLSGNGFHFRGVSS